MRKNEIPAPAHTLETVVRRPRTVAAPLSSCVFDTPRTRTAVSRSSAASIWSHSSSSSSSSSPSPLAVPFPLRLARSEPLLYKCKICCACGVRECSHGGRGGLVLLCKVENRHYRWTAGQLECEGRGSLKGELVRTDRVRVGARTALRRVVLLVGRLVVVG